jgi:hypothetical protein
MIPDRLRNIHHEVTMKKIQVFFWVREVRRGREDLSDEERPGRPPVDGLDERSRLSRRAGPIYNSSQTCGLLGISSHMVVVHLHEGLGMKSFYLR